jgi:hypothetical protein
MSDEELGAQDQSNDVVIGDEFIGIISQPLSRQLLYKTLLTKPPQAFCSLLLRLLQEEVDFRNALWNGETEDESNCYEGIYRCAFLLYRCADPRDTLVLWEAKHIDMDVGTSMGAEYFVGAGLRETLSFLEQCRTEEAEQIHEYVKDWFADPQALSWQKNWEVERADNIRSA